MRPNRFRCLLLITCLAVASASIAEADPASKVAPEGNAPRPLEQQPVTTDDAPGATIMAPTNAEFLDLLEKGGLERDSYVSSGVPQCPAVWICGFAPCGEWGNQGCLWRGTRCTGGSSCSDTDTGLTQCQAGPYGFSCLGGKTIHTRDCGCEGCPSSTCFDGCSGGTQRTLICK